MSSETRTVQVEIEPDSGELGIRNKDPELRSNILAQRLGECKVGGTLRGVRYGTYRGLSAVLMLFRFTFHSPLSRKLWRYTEAKIEITFFREKKAHEAELKPLRIVSMFPYTVNGNVSQERRQWTFELSVPVGLGPLSPVDVKVNPKVSRATDSTVEHRMQIQGLIYSSDPNTDLCDIAMWDMCENEVQEAGVPHDFFCGIVVLHGTQDFQADVKVRFTIPLGGGLRLSGWPWTKNDPLLFHYGTSLSKLDQGVLQQMEELLLGKDFAELTEADYRQLAPLPTEYQV